MRTPSVLSKRFTDPTPVFPIRHRERRSEDTLSNDVLDDRFLYEGEVPSPLSMHTVRPSLSGKIDSYEVNQKHLFIGKILGYISWSMVGLLWTPVIVLLWSSLMGVKLDLLDGLTSFSWWTSIVGVHVFGILSSFLSQRQNSLGPYSIGTFWLSVMGSVPITMLIGGFGLLL